MVEKWIDKIRRMERSRKQNDDGVESMNVENGIENVGRDRGMWMMRSRNVEANGGSLRSLDLAGGTSAEDVERSRDVECQRRHGRARREAYRPLNASISDRHTERPSWESLENEERLRARHWRIAGNNKIIPKMIITMKEGLRSHPSKMTNNLRTNWLAFETWALNNWEGKNKNNNGALTLTKVYGNSLIGATGYYCISAMPH
jgi:hypothetical protein